MITASYFLTAAYLLQLMAKCVLALRYARQVGPLETQCAQFENVTFLQPILSGDPLLRATLEDNLNEHPNSLFLWLVDEDDEEGQRVCSKLVQGCGPRRVEIIHCRSPAQGINPKAHKLAIALPKLRTEFFVVMDDDTRLSRHGLLALLGGLCKGAALATGLPRYGPGRGRCSGWIAEFVNSTAVLTYLPALNLSQPLSINGMCYAMRTRDALKLGLFRKIEKALTDDLAVAQELRQRGMRIHQTVTPHDIRTSVDSLGALLSLLHRWFVFSRILLQYQSVGTKVAVVAAYVVPPLLLWVMIIAALVSPSNFLLLGPVIVGRALLLQGIKIRFLSAAPWRLAESLALELAQPCLLLSACVQTTIRWRKRRIRVRGINDFEYLE